MNESRAISRVRSDRETVRDLHGPLVHEAYLVVGLVRDYDYERSPLALDFHEVRYVDSALSEGGHEILWELSADETGKRSLDAQRCCDPNEVRGRPTVVLPPVLQLDCGIRLGELIGTVDQVDRGVSVHAKEILLSHASRSGHPYGT